MTVKSLFARNMVRPGKLNAYTILTVLLVLTLALMSSGCSRQQEEAEKGKPVRTAAVKEETRPVRLEYFGITDSQEMKKYSFKVSGKISRIHVDKGDRITKGKLVAELDRTDLNYALKAAEYTMYKARSAYEDARKQYEKVKALYEHGVSSERDLDLARLDMEVKEAGYNQAKVDYDHKQSMLRDAGLYADMDGYVVEVLNKEGEVVSAGYPVIIARSSRQVINVGLTQDDLQKVKVGTRAYVIINGTEAKGEVTMIDQLPDSESRTYNAEITITGEPDNFNFYLGSTGRVLLEAGEEKGIWIPLTSILNDGQDYVYTVKENRALRKNIKILNIQDTSVLVEGLEPGDVLVTAGMKNLTDGCLVSPEELRSS